VCILSASTASFNKKVRIVKNVFTLQVRARAQLTSTDEIVLSENTCAPLCHALRSMLTNTLFWGKGQMMSLIVRKAIVLGLIGIIFLLANILVLANLDQ
jgi:hypothetical protein